MFTLKNSIKNIYRYKNKYILFSVLYIILLVVASVCVSIFFQMRTVNDFITREYASIVRIENVAALDSSTGSVLSRFTKDELLKFTEMEYIDDIKFFKYGFATTYLRDMSWDDWENSSIFLKSEIYSNGDVTPLEFPLSPVFVVGYNMSLLYLETNEFKLEKGRMFENGNEAVITKNRLRNTLDEQFGASNENKGWNTLDVGDKIAIRNDDGFYKEFTVVGILDESLN